MILPGSKRNQPRPSFWHPTGIKTRTYKIQGVFGLSGVSKSLPNWPWKLLTTWIDTWDDPPGNEPWDLPSMPPRHAEGPLMPSWDVPSWVEHGNLEEKPAGRQPWKLHPLKFKVGQPLKNPTVHGGFGRLLLNTYNILYIYIYMVYMVYIFLFLIQSEKGEFTFYPLKI